MEVLVFGSIENKCTHRMYPVNMNVWLLYNNNNNSIGNGTNNDNDQEKNNHSHNVVIFMGATQKGQTLRIDETKKITNMQHTQRKRQRGRVRHNERRREK